MAVKGSALWLVVGESGSGKTTFCQQILALVRQQGAAVGGLLCPARFENGAKVGFDVLDISSGAQRRLGWHRAIRPQPATAAPPIAIGEWLLDGEALEWGNQVLSRSTPCDLLVIDELGPLEFYTQQGWQAAMEVLDCGAFRLALVTMRPSLRDLARQRWAVSGETLLAKNASPTVLENELDRVRRFICGEIAC
jgi:nucleoside-triphosphatase THEP1